MAPLGTPVLLSVLQRRASLARQCRSQCPAPRAPWRSSAVLGQPAPRTAGSRRRDDARRSMLDWPSLSSAILALPLGRHSNTQALHYYFSPLSSIARRGRFALQCCSRSSSLAPALALKCCSRSSSAAGTPSRSSAVLASPAPRTAASSLLRYLKLKLCPFNFPSAGPCDCGNPRARRLRWRSDSQGRMDQRVLR